MIVLRALKGKQFVVGLALLDAHVPVDEGTFLVGHAHRP